jgi:hypothetical protein
VNTVAADPQLWFARCATPADAAERSLAQAWVEALDWPDASIRFVSGWRAAQTWLCAGRFAAGFWEREERLRSALREAAALRLGAAGMLERLTRATEQIGDALRDAAVAAAARDDVNDEGLIRAAAGAAALAAHQCALAQLADAPAAHPFFCKQRLFAGGRWPLGIFDHAGGALAVIL